MFMSFLEKIQTLFNYIFSSFLTIELFMLMLLFFFLLMLNIKRKQRIVNYFTSICVIIFMGIIIFLNWNYVVYCFDYFMEGIMKNILFPSTVVYFWIVFLVSLFTIITIFSKKDMKLKKYVNYISFSFIYLLFSLFIVEVISNKIILADRVELYTNNVILAIVQISDLIFVLWVIYTLFWYLFRYFKKKYDK